MIDIALVSEFELSTKCVAGLIMAAQVVGDNAVKEQRYDDMMFCLDFIIAMASLEPDDEKRKKFEIMAENLRKVMGPLTKMMKEGGM